MARPYGGPWTRQKLEILGKYLNAYTTALKNQPFHLMYVDAFAGTGEVPLEDGRIIVEGSASIAANVDDKPFDKLILVEKDADQCASLGELKDEHGLRNIEVVCDDANDYLRSLCAGWPSDYSNWRGVLFLDPFATQVEWTTVKAVAGTEALDTWILFPVSGISRILPRNKKPDEVSDSWKFALAKIFGGESWRELYRLSQQTRLFGNESHTRDHGVDGIIRIYKSKLQEILGNRLLDKSHRFRNSRNARIFELIFFAGHPNGRAIAHKIAEHLMKE